MTDQIPEVPVQPARRSLLQRISIVWLIPLAALAIALGIAWQSWHDRGALIEIMFQQASGIVPEQTELRFREVSVGLVEDLEFAPDLSTVIAKVRLDKEVEDYVDADSVFWVVAPEVSARGITGLETVLSGVYIEGSWDGDPGGLYRYFEGLEERPVARPDQEGVRIVLSSASGRGLSDGAPILFKGLEVGRVGRPVLSDDGVTITAEAFIEAPHDELLTTRSRFWDASGISFNIGATGASVDVESLASLVSGGVGFETVVSGGTPVEEGQVFRVFENVAAARENVFDGAGPEGGTLELAMVFEENVSGLQIGAPVQLRGLPIGEVVGISGRVDPEQFGDERVRLIVVLALQTDKLDAAPQVTVETEREEAILDFFERAVADGWRARLARTSILSPSLKIEMVQIEDAAPAEFIRDGDPYPIFPSVLSDQDGLSRSAEGLLQRVTDLPIEDIIDSTRLFLDNAAALVASEDIQSIPGDVRTAIGQVRDVLDNDALKALPERLAGLADEIEALVGDLNERDAVGRLTDTIDKAGNLAGNVDAFVGELTPLAQRVEGVAAKAEALDLEGLLARLTELAEAADGILDSEEARQLPATLANAFDGIDAAVEQASELLAEMNEAGAVETLTQAIGQVDAVAADVGEAVAGLPDLVDQVSAVAAKVEALELEGLLTRLTDLAESADGILDTEGARRLPETVSAAFEGIGTTVEETNAFLAELRAAGAIDTLTQAIEEVDAAAADVGEAVAGLPELVEQISAVAAKVEATEIDALVAELTGLVESAEAIVGTESAQALPQSLRQTLDEVSQALAELRAGGTVESVNAALASAQQAADSVAQASQELPGLVNRTEAVLREAELALAGLADSGALNREARAALREVSRAADSVRSLARTLERKPNALLTGK